MHHVEPTAPPLGTHAAPAPPVPGGTAPAQPAGSWVPVHLADTVLTRVLWLYGLHALASNLGYLVGYYLLPEGFLRGSPWVAVGGGVAAQPGYWSQFGLTLLINIGYLGFGVSLNLMRVRGLPQGYLIPLCVGVTGGLIAGSNSFAASDLRLFTARDGQALALSIGGLEMLAYILVVAATTKLGVWQYSRWYDLHEQPVKVMPLRAVRLSRAEIGCLLLGLALLVLGAHRETLMALGQPHMVHPTGAW